MLNPTVEAVQFAPQEKTADKFLGPVMLVPTSLKLQSCSGLH